MGSKTKFWCHLEDNSETKWLFKYPRPNTGEHWAEKIAAEVARLLGLSHARVELAKLEDQRGSATKSFMLDDQVLIHGNQILGESLGGYDSQKTFQHSDHTLKNIFDAIETRFPTLDAANRAKTKMGAYFVLDALIGNTDRHHENWGILCHHLGNTRNVSLAPTYDHASSLGRELTDHSRNKLLETESIPKYSAKGRGAVYWARHETHAPSPLELVRRSVCDYKEFFRPALVQLHDVSEESIQNIVDSVPPAWMTESAKAFSSTFMCYNLNRLRKIDL